MLGVFVWLLLMSVATAASADDRDNEPFTVIGIGNTTCGSFLNAMEGERMARPPNADPDGIYSQKYGGYLDFADGFSNGRELWRYTAEPIDWAGERSRGTYGMAGKLLPPRSTHEIRYCCPRATQTS